MYQYPCQVCSLLINLWDFFFGRFWCLPFFFHHRHTYLGALFCPSPSFWKLCIAQCRSPFSDTILLASVECAAFLFINLRICYILKSAVKSEIYLILVLIYRLFCETCLPSAAEGTHVWRRHERGIKSTDTRGEVFMDVIKCPGIANIAVFDFNMA